MPRKKAQVEASLKNKGFEQKDGNHHFFVYVTIAGQKTTVRTKTSHTPKTKDIPDNLLAQMGKQCQLSQSGFSRLVDCPLSRESYEDILKNKGIFSE
jgi:predicted RNA binding protein YcfA (HicA-like mRNA interferase family)